MHLHCSNEPYYFYKSNICGLTGIERICSVLDSLHAIMTLLDKIAYNLICKPIGHNVVNEDHSNFSADCARCGLGLDITYDMAYGETYVTGEYERI